MYFINQTHSNQLIIIFTILLISISQTHQTDATKSLKTRIRQGRNVDLSNDEQDKTKRNVTLTAESRQSEGDDLQFSSKPYYSSRLNDQSDSDYFNLPSSNSQHQHQKRTLRRNSISAPDFQANAAGFVLPDYLANSANTASSSNNILNKLSPYDNVGLSNGHSTTDDYNGGGYENSFVPVSTNMRERRKGSNYLLDTDTSQKSNFYDRQMDYQNQFDALYSNSKSQSMKNPYNNQVRDNEFASNSLLESVTGLDNNQDFGFGNNFLSNDFGANSNYNTELSTLNNLSGLRSLNALSALNQPLGVNNAYNSLSPLTASSSIVGTLGGSLNGLNGLSSVVPPGAIVGAPGSQPPPGMKLAGYVTVTNPSPNVGSIPSASNLLASPATQQQMLFSQVMNRSPQAQAIAQVMAQIMAQGIRIPFANPYANNLQLIAPAALNGMVQSSSTNSGSKNTNSNSDSNKESNNNDSNSNQSNNNEQQVAASSTNRAKFLQRLNPLNLFRRLRTRNQKNNSNKNNKDQSGGNSNEINNIPDLEDRSQFFLPAELLLGTSNTNQQQQQLTVQQQQQQLAEQLSAQLAQLNMQLAQQSNNKAKFLRKIGPENSLATNIGGALLPTLAVNKKIISKRDVSNQLNQSLSTEDNDNRKNPETIPYSLENDKPLVKTSQNDTETAENFSVGDIYQNYKFNIRPRFRFPSVREQRRISNSHGLHVNTNNFLTSSSMKSNFVGLMGSRNYEVIAGGILNNEGHRNTEPSMLHGMHSNNGQLGPNHKLQHHHQNQRNQMIPNKGKKFNIDNDFDDDDDSEEDDHSGAFNSRGGANPRNGNNLMFLDDLFGSNMHSGKNNGMLGFQGFNSFNGNSHHFNALSSATSHSNQQLNGNTTNQFTTNHLDNTSEHSQPTVLLTDIQSTDHNANQTIKI